MGGSSSFIKAESDPLQAPAPRSALLRMILEPLGLVLPVLLCAFLREVDLARRSADARVRSVARSSRSRWLLSQFDLQDLPIFGAPPNIGLALRSPAAPLLLPSLSLSSILSSSLNVRLLFIY